MIRKKMILIQPLILESKNLDCLLELTNDFIISNILPKYDIIKIITQEQSDKWISIIEYKERKCVK